MRSNRQNTADSSMAVNDYEAAVLEYLDKEISASSKPVQDGNTQQDDVEALFLDLLKMAFAGADEPDPHQEVEPHVGNPAAHG